MKKHRTPIKAIVSLMLVIFMIYSGMSMGVVAYAATERIIYVEDNLHNALPDDPDSPALNYTLEEYIVAEMQKCETSIDLSSYYIAPAKINDIASFIYDNSPELFHVTRFGYTTIFGYILTLNPEYNCTAEEYQVKIAECDAVAEDMVKDIRDNDNITDVEKALLLHDRIALNCDYDYENYLNGTISDDSYSMYGILVDGIGVCQGYAEAYLYVLRKIGIHSYLAESDILNHAWNVVTIDGEEYHVDITWDDPVYDVTGRVTHDNFLRSSDGMYETGHAADDYVNTPTSTKYDNYFWQNSSAAFQLIDNELYYIDETDSYIKKYSDNSNVKSVSDMWMTSISSYYPGCYARLAADENYLYYNSSQAVFQLNPATGETTEIWRPESVTAYYRIYGFNYADNYLICDFNTSPYFSATTKTNYQQRLYYTPGEAATLTGISINTYPDVTDFDINEAYTADGLSLLLEYSDGSTAVITNGFTVNTADTSEAGTKTVTVTYEDFTVTYTINVACKHKDVTNVAAKASTCIEQGNNAYTKCNICNTLVSGSDELLPFAGHNHVSEVTVPPTCTEDGEMTYTCSVCSDSYTETIKSEGHSYNSIVIVPTCTEKGYTKYTCACGDFYIDNHVNATGHDYVSEVVTPATHTQDGLALYTCNGCGDTYTETIEKTTDHSYNSVVTPPTCTAQGYTTYTCACGDTYVADYTNKTDHDYAAVVTDPTCTAQGYTTYTCACGDTYVADYTDATGHDYAAVVTPPTCTAEGYTTYTCTCSDSYVDNYTDATGHDYVSEVVTPATHTQDGLALYTCNGCGDTYTETIEKTTEHSYNSVVTAPTCTAQGYTTYTCACGDTYVADYTNKTDHDYAAVVTDPTCTAQGYTTYTCACGDDYVADYTNKTDHDYASVVTDPTCTAQGYTTYTCACGDAYVNDYTDATGHDHKSTAVVFPTCTEEGYTVYTCTCGDTYADDHVDPDENAHVNADGDLYCDECNALLNDCSCNCHSTNAFISFFWKILNFLQKLFGTNPVCACGMAHY